jgi:hypothetical protein
LKTTKVTYKLLFEFYELPFSGLIDYSIIHFQEEDHHAKIR